MPAFFLFVDNFIMCSDNSIKYQNVGITKTPKGHLGLHNLRELRSKIGNIIYGGEISLKEFREYLALQGRNKNTINSYYLHIKIITNGIWSPLAANVRCYTGKTS